MYQNKARPRLRLNLKSQPGYNVSSSQRFPRNNSTQQWNSPSPQNQMKSGFPLKTNFKPEFSQHCRKSPVPNNAYDFNDQGHHSRQDISPGEFRNSSKFFQESQDEASSFNNFHNQTPYAYDSLSLNNPRLQKRFSPLNSLNESGTFSRNVLLDNPQNTEETFLGSSSFKNVIPGLDDYNDQYKTNCDDYLEKFGIDFSDKWRKQDTIPFLGESNNPSCLSNSPYSSKHSIDLNSDFGERCSRSTANINDGLWIESETKDKYQESIMPENRLLENTHFIADGKGFRNENRDKCESKSVLEQALETLVTEDAVVGLDYIVEYKNSLSSASSLSFRCKLCNSAISRPTILDHVMGEKHRLRYMKMKDEKRYNQLLALNVGQTLRGLAISAACSEFEQLHGRGKVRIELKHEDSCIPSNFEENPNSSSAVLSFSDIPIVSEDMSPQHEFTSSSAVNARNNEAKGSSRFQQEADLPPDVAFRNTNKMSLLEENQASHFPTSETYSSSSVRQCENPRFETDIQEYENVSHHPFSSQASLSDSRENIVYSNYANRPISCAQEENHSVQHPYDNQSLAMNANTDGGFSHNRNTHEVGIKRPASSMYFHPDDHSRKIKKTNAELDNANETSSQGFVQPQHSLSEMDKSSTSPVFINTSDSSKSDLSVLPASENSKLNSSLSNDSHLATKESCSSETKLEENVSTDSILEVLMKCTISSEEDASSILKVITVLIELFIKYKLQHVPRNTVEFFIKSLHEGHTEDILKFLGHFDSDKKGFSFGVEGGIEGLAEGEISKFSDRQAQLQNPFGSNSVMESSTAIKQELSGTSLPSNPEDHKLDTKFGFPNSIGMQGMKTEAIGNAQYCNAYNNTESAGIKNYDFVPQSTAVSPNNFNVPPPSVPAKQLSSTAESLQPPPFFAQPATTKQDWSNNQVPFQASYPTSQDHLRHGDWNTPFQASMPYTRGPYLQPPPHGPMGGGTQQFMGMPQFPQHFPPNQHFVNQQFYPNMAQSANVNIQKPPLMHGPQPPLLPHPPLPSGPHPPLPTGPQPPVPSRLQPPLPPMPNPPLPPPDSQSVYGLGSNMQLTPTSTQFAPPPPLPPQPPPQPPPPPMI